MKNLILLFICLSAGLQFCAAQSTSKKEFYSKDFNWRIIIPENYIAMDSAEMAIIEREGAAAIDKANNTKVENHATLVFSFKSDKLNNFQCSYQPFDPAVDGNFLAAWKGVNNILYKTFTTQLQGVKVDTATTVEKISDLEFHTFKATVTYPNKLVLHMLMYSRLFDKREFMVDIVYEDEVKGQQMLNAWKGSIFGK